MMLRAFKVQLPKVFAAQERYQVPIDGQSDDCGDHKYPCTLPAAILLLEYLAYKLMLRGLKTHIWMRG